MMTKADIDKHVQSLSERRELSDAARVLLRDKAFGHAYWSIHQRWYNDLVHLPHGGPKQDELVAKLRAIEEFLKELELLLPTHDEARRA
jgi:hypothetical protein